MIVVQKRILHVNEREQVLRLPADAQVLHIAMDKDMGFADGMYLGVFYLNTGGEDIERRFWILKTLQQVDDNLYGQFKFITSVATTRGLMHVFERFYK